MKSAAEWKTFYARERESLGDVGLAQRLDRAPELELGRGEALVFPHTMLAVTGHLTAAVARAVMRSGADEVLALGVLHGGREQDAERVKRARDGDPAARGSLRRVHAAADALCAEEFSLDGFLALLALAAAREGRTPPRVVARYPFLVGDDPATLPGLDDVLRLAERLPVVATTDPLHHGAGYGTPEGARRAESDAGTPLYARTAIERQLDQLLHGEWTAFQELAATVRSDFRDTGPVLACALPATAERRGELLELHLVDYAEVLRAERPTWVAGPLMRMTA
ncbi:MAG TPA: hypothetical protein VGL81_16265 [Polyangiaceae bacterium]